MIASFFIFQGIFFGVRLPYQPLISFSQLVLLAVLQVSLFMIGTLVLVFWRREAWSGRLRATETKKGRIIVATLMPALPWFGVQLLDIEEISSPVIDSLFSLSCFAAPLLLGFWAGLQWPGRHFKGYILLGVAAGLSAWIGWEAGKLVQNAGGEAADDLFFLGGVAAVIFFAGELFADVLKNKTNPHLLSEGGFAQRIATRLAGPGNKPNRNVVLLVQAMLPTATAILGFLTALVGLYKAI
jgi:hypothetical protein